MLIEFTVENYLSFKEQVTFSMVAEKAFKELPDNLISNGKFNLLKSAVVYGNNASGKSNLLQAMGFMKTVVIRSFRDALDNKEIELEKFALSSKTENETSFFEISFIHKSTPYRYGFELDYQRVVAEWLFHTTTKEVYLFRRNGLDVEINKSAFKEGLGKDEDLKENVLFLSLLATLGKEISSNIVDWFKGFNFINGVYDNGHKNYTKYRLKTDKKFLQWVSTFVKYLEISNISIDEEDLNNESESHSSTLEEESKSKLKQERMAVKNIDVLTHHKVYDENNVLVSTISFNIDELESEGTKKLIYLLGPWYDTLQNGKILFVDELDSRLHSKLTMQLINFFHKFNENGAQLICALHDTSVLNKDYLRRDQIYFVEKNQFGVSYLLSLGDFKTDQVRSTSSFSKNYLEGKFGAVPYFEFDDSLKHLISNE